VSDLDAEKKKKNDAIFWFPAARDAFLPHVFSIEKY
jgi:hypothetical protein